MFRNDQIIMTCRSGTQWSDREIARRVGVDHKSVGKLRPNVSGEVPQIERKVERNGQTYIQNTANSGEIAK